MPETIRATGSVNLGYTYHIYIYIFIHIRMYICIINMNEYVQIHVYIYMYLYHLWSQSPYHSPLSHPSFGTSICSASSQPSSAKADNRLVMCVLKEMLFLTQEATCASSSSNIEVENAWKWPFSETSNTQSDILPQSPQQKAVKSHEGCHTRIALASLFHACYAWLILPWQPGHLVSTSPHLWRADSIIHGPLHSGSFDGRIKRWWNFPIHLQPQMKGDYISKERFHALIRSIQLHTVLIVPKSRFLLWINSCRSHQYNHQWISKYHWISSVWNCFNHPPTTRTSIEAPATHRVDPYPYGLTGSCNHWFPSQR